MKGFYNEVRGEMNERLSLILGVIWYYIVDFYCPSDKLIIELDGEAHFNEEAQEYDAKRTKDLKALGFKVIRFENKMVYNPHYALENLLQREDTSKYTATLVTQSSCVQVLSLTIALRLDSGKT